MSDVPAPRLGGSRPSPLATTSARALTVAVGAVALGALHLSHRPATVCPLRAATGIPCPFCGGTTAVADLGRGHLSAAVIASPLALALVLWLPFARVVSAPSWWVDRPNRRRVLVFGVLVAAEIWQLLRFHVVRV